MGTNIYYRFGNQGPRYGYQWRGGGGGVVSPTRAAETKALGSLGGTTLDGTILDGNVFTTNSLSGDTLGALLWESQAPTTKQYPPVFSATRNNARPVATTWKLPAVSDWPSDRPAGPEPLDPSGLGGIVETVQSPAARMISAGAMAYHGYKRTGSGFWAVLWSAFGGVSPVLAVPISVAQGFSKKKRRKNPARKRRRRRR